MTETYVVITNRTLEIHASFYVNLANCFIFLTPIYLLFMGIGFHFEKLHHIRKDIFPYRNLNRPFPTLLPNSHKLVNKIVIMLLLFIKLINLDYFRIRLNNGFRRPNSHF